jgi:hypothetical protein
VSGILTTLAEQAVFFFEEAVFFLSRRAGHVPETAPSGTATAEHLSQQSSPKPVALSADVWVAYALGATFGAFLEE